MGVAYGLDQALQLLWPELNLADLRGSLPAFTAAVALEIQRHAQASATLASRQYVLQREAAGVTSSFRPVPADPPVLAQITATVDWATQPLWSAEVLAHPNLDAASGRPSSEVVTLAVPEVPEAPEAPSIPAGEPGAASAAIAEAKARLAAASEKLVLDAGRDTIVDNVQADRKAIGWARVPEQGACYFCAMLATRGAVYRSEKSASFETHDNCRCHAEPVFTAYEPSAAVRQAQALWATSTRGKSGNAARIAFRQAVEGRTAPSEG